MDKFAMEFNGFKVGDTITNPSVGTFTVAAINADQDRTLLVNQNPNSFNRYVGAWGLQKTHNSDSWSWSQGHYHGNDFQAAIEYVMNMEFCEVKI